MSRNRRFNLREPLNTRQDTIANRAFLNSFSRGGVGSSNGRNSSPEKPNTPGRTDYWSRFWELTKPVPEPAARETDGDDASRDDGEAGDGPHVVKIGAKTLDTEGLFDLLDRRAKGTKFQLGDRARGIVFRSMNVVDARPTPGGGLRVIASDDSVDRVGDVIEPGGWRLEAFKRNPIWLASHNYDIASIVGRAENVRVEHRALVADFAPDPPDSSPATATVLAKLASGSLRGVSIGFRPLRFETIRNEKGVASGVRYLESELLEISWVAVPANSNAGRSRASSRLSSAAISALSMRFREALATIRSSRDNPPSGPRREALAQRVAEILARHGISRTGE
jgi:HK97 family phage prohead protease